MSFKVIKQYRIMLKYFSGYYIEIVYLNIETFKID